MQSFMPANSLLQSGRASSPAKSPDRGTVRRCSAAFGLDAEQGIEGPAAKSRAASFIAKGGGPCFFSAAKTGTETA